MNKIDVLTFNNLEFPNGVNEVVKSFWEGKEIFQENRISLNYIYGYDGKRLQDLKKQRLDKSKISSKNQMKKNKFLKVKNKINTLARNNRILSFIIIYKRFIFRAKRMILEYLKKNTEADTIIFNDLFSAYFYLKYRNSNKNTVLILHTNGNNFEQINIYYPKQFLFLKKYFLKIEIETLEKINKIIFVSKNSMLNFVSLFPKYKSKTIYIYNGIKDINYVKYHKNENEKYIKFICVGNFNKRKGQEILIEAVNDLKIELRQRIKVTFIGGGPELENCMKMTKKMGLDKTIEFLGIKKNSEKFLKYQDFFILPSFDEGLPISIIEALRQGIPVIASRVGGIPEMLDDFKNGFLINAKKEDIIRIIEEIVEKKYNLEEMSKAARKKYLTNFNLEKMINEYCQLINTGDR